MRATKTLISTAKEKPNNAKLISHQYMIRSGLIRQLSSGIYTWLPTGTRVLQKIINIVRDEMNKIGSNEIILPNILPAELLKETQRWEEFGPELLKIQDRNKRDFCYGPTHEETIVELARKEITSYKQLPLNLYQIQTKFRDEIRPRFGIMRSREFIMKDAYSFHTKQTCLEKTYRIMQQTYNHILKRIGIKFHIVEADAGAIGGNVTHEFQVPSKTGEDIICYNNDNTYSANIELANYLKPDLGLREAPSQKLQKITAPNLTSIENLTSTKILKTLMIKDSQKKNFVLVLCSGHKLNVSKINKLTLISPPFYFPTEEEIIKVMGSNRSFIGPIYCKIPIIVDYSAAILNDFACGANENNCYYIGANWERDVKNFEVAHLRNVIAGDLSPDGKGQLSTVNSIEVGHIFQLGVHYSKAMNATILNENGKKIPMIMGCYGLGVSRIIAASIEQFHDNRGIIWPPSITPFDIIIMPINMHKSAKVAETAERLYTQLKAAGFDTLLDDRKKRAGIMFADADLIGAPHQIIISEHQLKKGKIEYKSRIKKKIKIILCDLESILKHVSL